MPGVSKRNGPADIHEGWAGPVSREVSPPAALGNDAARPRSCAAGDAMRGSENPAGRSEASTIPGHGQSRSPCGPNEIRSNGDGAAVEATCANADCPSIIIYKISIFYERHQPAARRERLRRRPIKKTRRLGTRRVFSVHRSQAEIDLIPRCPAFCRARRMLCGGALKPPSRRACRRHRRRLRGDRHARWRPRRPACRT